MPFPQCNGRVDDHLSGHTSPASQVQTSTVMVLPAIYPVSLGDKVAKTNAARKKNGQKTASSTHSNNKVE